MSEPIYQQVVADVKTAMKARDKKRLSALRLMMSEFKRVEVDERIEIDNTRALVILDKMTKQRKDSFTQFSDAGRDDLAEIEAFEMAVINEYLPQGLTGEEISQLVADAVSESGASSMQDMGKVMAILKPQMQGRADMSEVSALVKQQLS